MGQNTITLSEFARRLGVSPATVTKAVQEGRLRKSIGKVKGRIVIRDEELARQEWSTNTRRAAAGSGRNAVSLLEAQRRVTLERARSLKIANAVKLGTLIAVAQAEREAFEAARTIREAMLNIPDRIAAELAGQTKEAKVHARLETEIRLALEAAAGKLKKASA